jgi:hypothetical protein
MLRHVINHITKGEKINLFMPFNFLTKAKMYRLKWLRLRQVEKLTTIYVNLNDAETALFNVTEMLSDL